MSKFDGLNANRNDKKQFVRIECDRIWKPSIYLSGLIIIYCCIHTVGNTRICPSSSSSYYYFFPNECRRVRVCVCSMCILHHKVNVIRPAINMNRDDFTTHLKSNYIQLWQQQQQQQTQILKHNITLVDRLMASLFEFAIGDHVSSLVRCQSIYSINNILHAIANQVRYDTFSPQLVDSVGERSLCFIHLCAFQLFDKFNSNQTQRK